jgi:dipeptidyl aminopeptidase/acylaminoacyl peptidase
MFEYFPSNYPWSMSLLMALDMGGNLSEIDDICRPLRDAAASEAIGAWVERWSASAHRLRDAAESDERAGHAFSAHEKYKRSSVYLLVAERQASPSDARKLALYREALDLFRRGVAGERVEFVDVPYQGGALPALFVPADTDGPAPCIVHLNGLDSVKETSYLRMARAYAERGIAVLLLDQPGSGGALRLHDLPAIVETERPVAACIDMLEKRDDVDPKRIGVQGVSMGGYYAPRAAAFEPRLACCVALGAFHDFLEISQMARDRGPDYANSVSDMPGQLKWVAGTEDLGEAIQLFAKFTLEEVAGLITCPLLIVHGGRDRQIPRDHGQKTWDAAKNSSRRELVLIEDEGGGVEHCSNDNLPRARAIITDWVADVLDAKK